MTIKEYAVSLAVGIGMYKVGQSFGKVKAIKEIVKQLDDGTTIALIKKTRREKQNRNIKKLMSKMITARGKARMGFSSFFLKTAEKTRLYFPF